MANINVEGKFVVITGGSTGIGSGMVDAFNDNGAHGVIIDFKAPVRIHHNWKFVHCDLTDEVQVESAFDDLRNEVPSVDVLIANAGIVPEWSSVSGTSLEVWDRVMAINARGLFLTLKHGFELLTKPGGSVIVTGSINSFRGDPNIVPYVASKHAALGIVRSAAMDFGKAGIRVNAIGPGPIATEALLDRVSRRTEGTQTSVDASLHAMESHTALGRLATIEDVANTALFLASEMAAGITGQILFVDAGLM